MQSLKKAIWIYFFLLIFEGALRKWFLPELAVPLLIIRDPVALWILFTARNKHLFKVNPYIFVMFLIGVTGIITTTTIGHGNLIVALYGARILLLHFPLIFVIGAVFTKEDVIQMGKVILWMSIPMTILIAIQFYSPQSAWVNRGIGGDIEGGGFAGALGFFRPPGTFSFTNGNTLFYSVVSSFIFYFWINAKEIKRPLLIISSICLVAAIPLSISRTLFFSIGIAWLFGLVAISQRQKYFSRMVLISLFSLLIVTALLKFSFFQTATEAFSERFEIASDFEGGLKGTLSTRFLGGMLGAITGTFDQHFFGYGLGMGTNVGAQLLRGDRTIFLISEEEWGRLIGELGPLLGLAVIFIRLHLTFSMAVAAFRRIKFGEVLPWMLISFGVLIIPEGQWAQPTTLGFATLIGGLILASFNEPEAQAEQTIQID